MKNSIIKYYRILNLGFCLFLFTSYAYSCDIKTIVKQATVSEIKSHFESTNKQVLTFTGYSGAGYEDQVKMLTQAQQTLDDYDPALTIVNIGATPEGIGAVYELAMASGFQTTGIVSTQAKKYDAALAKCVQQVFYVEDETWGGFLNDSKLLSPTSDAMVSVSDIVVAIGGGEVGRDELLAALSQGKYVRFVSAQMNHQIAKEKAIKKGLTPPTQFEGATAQAIKGF